MFKHVECVRALLPVTDLAATDGHGETALYNAVATDSEACLELLLPTMSDVDVRTVPGVTPSGEALDSFGWTALHLVCQNGNLPMCKALLGLGADQMARDSYQCIPLHYAAMEGSLACAIMLVGRPGEALMTPAEVDAADDGGRTALHYAAVYGFDQICAVLLGAGARLDARTTDAFGATPLFLAVHAHPTNAAMLALLSGDATEQLPGLVCDHCGKTEQASVKSLKTCARCYDVRYCSKQCQLAAWPEHKAACDTRVKEREDRSRVNPVSERPIDSPF